MKKTSSIIEEALIEASQLEEAVKEVGKEVLASAMKQEIENLIKSSLTEEEEVESPEMDSMGMETPEAPEMGGQEGPEVPEMPNDNEMPEAPEMGDEDDEMSEIPEMGNEDDDEVMDMTQSPDSEVIKVFKAMGPEDSIEVTKTDNGVRFKDGDKEYILQMEGIEELDDDELDELLDDTTFDDDFEIDLEDDDEITPRRSKRKSSKMDDEDLEFENWMNEIMGDDENEEEVMYEIELDEEEVMDEDIDEDGDDEELEEAARTLGFGRGKEVTTKGISKGLPKAITPNRQYVKNESLIRKLSLVETELKDYKSKNEEYKKALTTLKEKMNEMAVYYTNLSYTNKLFTEHTTTKKEKLDILKRFDTVKSINESKNMFNTISNDLSNKKSISNLLDLSENMEKTLTSGTSKLTESVVYEDPKIKQIKELMAKISPSRK
jgi:hypothetical protein